MSHDRKVIQAPTAPLVTNVPMPPASQQDVVPAAISKHLEEKGFLLEGTRQDLLKNSLVLIGSSDVKDKIKSIEDLKAGGVKIALGELNTVPAGKYAKQAFERLNMWNEIEKEAIYQKDVTAVLTIVDS